MLWAGKVSNAEQVAIVLWFLFFFWIRHEKGKALPQLTLAEPQACEPGNGPAQLQMQPALVSGSGPCADATRRQTIAGPRAGQRH